MFELTLTCGAEADNLDMLDAMIGLALDRNGVKDARRFAFAAHELLINSVEAMSRLEEIRFEPLQVKLNIDDALCAFQVTDRAGGIPARLLAERDPDDASGLCEESGRGLSLVRLYADVFEMIAEDDGSYTYRMAVRR